MRIGFVLICTVALCAALRVAVPVNAQTSGNSRVACNIVEDPGDYDVRDRDAACLQELGARVRRTGDKLLLTLNNGTIKSFGGNPCPIEGEAIDRNCVSYFLVGFHAASERYVVEVQRASNSTYWLVSARTGKSTTLPGVPVFTPDGTRFFVDWYEGPGVNQWLGIGSIESGVPSLDWKFGPLENQSWTFERWLSNEQAVVRNVGGGDVGRRSVQVTRTKDGWNFDTRAFTKMAVPGGDER